MMDAALRAFVRERSGGCCEYFQLREEHAGRLAFQIEHIIAKEHGGILFAERTEEVLAATIPDLPQAVAAASFSGSAGGPVGQPCCGRGSRRCHAATVRALCSISH